MGLDWSVLSLSGYLEAVECWNEESGESKVPAADTDRLDRFNRAHGLH